MTSSTAPSKEPVPVGAPRAAPPKGSGRRPELGLYVITDPELSLGRSHEEVATQALEGGANVIQLRDKHASTKALYEAGLKLKALTARAGALFIVNDRVDIALAVDADGVHLGQDDLPAIAARRLLGSHKVLGVSVENAEQARKAAEDGASYVAIGPIYEARGSKPDAGVPLGAKVIAELRQHTRLPIVAIGGIKNRHLAELFKAGADGVAVISAIAGAKDILAATREMKRLILEARG